MLQGLVGFTLFLFVLEYSVYLDAVLKEVFLEHARVHVDASLRVPVNLGPVSTHRCETMVLTLDGSLGHVAHLKINTLLIFLLKFGTAVDLNKCLKQVKLASSLYVYTPIT